VTGAGQFSLAGAQAKVAVHFDDGQWGLPTGRIPTTHILKPAIPDLPDQDISEYLAMRAARLAGLPVPDVSVQMFNDERAFVVRRFDRQKTSSGWRRIHQEDMCQALGLSPSRKYEIHQGPGAARVVRLIRQSVTGGRHEEDVWRFVDALIFNALVVGTDAHAKNYSFLIAAGQVRLSPLYDVNSYLPYQRPRQHPEMSMRIGAKARPDLVTGKDWLPDGLTFLARVRATVRQGASTPGTGDRCRDWASRPRARRCTACSPLARRPAAPGSCPSGYADHAGRGPGQQG